MMASCKRIGILLVMLGTSNVFITGFSTNKLQPKMMIEQESKAQPRTGILQNVLDYVLESPLWKTVLVPQARANIVKTAEENGIRWNEAKEWIRNQFDETIILHNENEYPDYYLKPFHAYESGNLCWEAAFEAELASRAVGARNFPAFGEKGEDAFRASFEDTLIDLGATCKKGGTVIDLGCGTGTGTRRIADKWPEAKEIIGIDYSPYFIAVGKKLLELSPDSIENGGPWVTRVSPNSKLSLRVGDASNTDLPDGCADVVNVGLVVHELPYGAACEICNEALRLLKPGGQLWLYEMDFDSPGFSQQRENPLLFSLIRSTEPWLDIYADNCDSLRSYICERFFNVRIAAATGRHYALVATKPKENEKIDNQMIDLRFGTDGSYGKSDTHLKTWESKEQLK